MSTSPVSLTNSFGLTRLAELRKQGVLTDEVAEKLCEKGQALRLRGHKVDWNGILDHYKTAGDLNREELEQVADFTIAAQTARKQMEQRFKENESKPTAVQLKKMQALDAYLDVSKGLHTAYVEATSRAAIGALAGASFGPLNTVAAYLAWNPAPANRLGNLIDQLKKLEAGNSELVHSGNQVTPVHQEKLWQAKLQMLDEAIVQAQAGNAPEIDVQYYEMTSSSFVGRLAEAAEAGCKVRVNIDPSRPRQSDCAEVSVDESPRKLRALLQLLAVPKGDVGVSVYPVAEELGNIQQLMHRKLLRVGEKVLFGGMNANEGSGENFDTGYLVEGPAARKLVEGFQQDVLTSAGSTPLQVYGQKVLSNFEEGMLGLTPHGLATTLDIIAGPSPAGVRIPSHPTLAQLEELASKAGLKLSSLVDEDQLKHQLQYRSTKPMELKPKGKKMLHKLMTDAFERTGSRTNVNRLKDMQLPEGKPEGGVRVAVGSSSEEREALILQAIATAEKFCYVPTFVITKAMARALVARRDELAAQGKTLDVRVVADAGIYQFGGTPNDEGYLALEDAGIPVHWALLTRVQGDHDRKIHAKQVLTDKMELVGSTNLSNKGVRDNWELSGLVYFDENAAESMAARQDGVERFEKLWKYESIAFDSRAAAILQDITSLGMDQSRKKSIRTVLNMIQNYEVQTSKLIEQEMASPALAERADELQRQGMAWGYARLKACEESFGVDGFAEKLKTVPMRAQIDAFARGEAVTSELAS
ncbi:MAG: phospholipase D-like domain-containing protein [Vulcanimicrobiota bacterium]